MMGRGAEGVTSSSLSSYMEVMMRGVREGADAVGASFAVSGSISSLGRCNLASAPISLSRTPSGPENRQLTYSRACSR